MVQQTEVIILLGGGLDSTALVQFYRDRGTTLQGLHIDYGQPSAAAERRAVAAICGHYDLPLDVINLGTSLASQEGEYRSRNALLLLIAAGLRAKPLPVAIGIHSGVPYYDTTAVFVTDINRLFHGYTGGAAQAEAPFLHFGKRDIYAYGLQAGVPFELTFSCERSSDIPCGDCPSCLDRNALNESK